MADTRRKRVAEFIAPFRVEPGSRVKLARDFDPRFKAGIKKKKDGVALLENGVGLLAEYQARLAAQDSGVCWWCCRRSMRPGRTARSGM